MHYRLIKSEPNCYSREDLVVDKSGTRDGVRSYQARNNLAKMEVWDLCLFYHSNIGKEIVWVCQVTKSSYPDLTDDTDRRVVVDVAPVSPLPHPVTLAQIKSDPKLSEMILIRQSRLSVAPVTEDEFEYIMNLGHVTN